MWICLLHLIANKISTVYNQYKIVLAIQAIFYQHVAKCKYTFHFKISTLLFRHSRKCYAIIIELNSSHSQKQRKYVTEKLQQKEKTNKASCSL